MFNWDDFRFFQAVKKARTLKGAAIHLGTDQATVGRRLYALEDELGVKLFEKRSNGYFLTAAGERVTQSIDQIEDAFDGVSRKIAGDEMRFEGTIRIAVPGALANHRLIHGLKSFLTKHPGITLQFLTGSEVVNLAKREAELAIRLVKPNQQSLYVRKLGVMTIGLYASKSLLKERGFPKNLPELESLPFVGLVEESMTESEDRFLAPAKPHLRYTLKCDGWGSVYQGLLAQLGFGVLPDFIANQDKSLECIPVMEPVSTPIWLVLHPDLKNNARVRALFEELKKLF